jgi:hypothetical protein
VPGSTTSTVPLRSMRTHEWVYLVMRADRELVGVVVMGSLDSRLPKLIGPLLSVRRLHGADRRKTGIVRHGYPILPLSSGNTSPLNCAISPHADCDLAGLCRTRQ